MKSKTNVRNLDVRFLFILFNLFVCAPALAEDGIVGKFASLDNKAAHEFRASGDYEGGYFLGNGTSKTVNGIYKYGEGVCSAAKKSGNLALIYENVFCCLRADKVSDKIAIFYIGSSSYEGELGIGVCRNQVLKRVEW